MKRNPTPLVAIIVIITIVCWIFYAMMPQSITENPVSLSEFSTKSALKHVGEMSKNPHYVGTQSHENVAIYLENELKKMGLTTEIQEGYTLSDWGNLVKSKNILAKIKGNGTSKSLLLLSHYDSAPHSKSKGASDDATGVATILEGIRAFLHNKSSHKNDIIILFSDAEELGLNGAALFVKQHLWAKEIGFAINFEARGTAGPAYMLMEVNKGNSTLVENFSNANVQYPVSNSLMYSIYKMLPNDTDLTVFRAQGKIQGLNFAFIDNHFNYHTQQDDVAHLDIKSLAHQGTYMMPLLYYFSNADLNNLDSNLDHVYFNTPFNFINYPFSWIVPMLIFALLLFFVLVFVGFGKRILNSKEITKGLLLFLGFLLFTALITRFGWTLLLLIYPQYNDILHGFTYNGHDYIAVFVCLTLCFGFLFYRKSTSPITAMNYALSPLVIWLLINSGIAFALPGAGFFIIPVFAALFAFGYFIVTQKTSAVLNLLAAVPTLIVFAPFVTALPIGLGLKLLFASTLLIALMFGLLLPLFVGFSRKLFLSLLFFVVAVGFFVKAHNNAGYEYGKAKPNSLVYLYNTDNKKAIWTTYDKNIDQWTQRYLGKNPKSATQLNDLKLFSKYNSKFTFFADAPVIALSSPRIEFAKDTIVGNQRQIKIIITPQRKQVNRYDIFANEKMVLYNFKANGAIALNQKGSKYERKGNKILSYYVVDNAALEMEFSIDKKTILDLNLMESSFDLLEQPTFAINPRASWMMPTPFVLNDAVVIQQKIKSNITKPEIQFRKKNAIRNDLFKDSIPVLNDKN
jgi:hypothetical protein